jgi:putative hydrolase of the HAD superfamily
MFYLSNMPAPYADHLERENAFIADFDDGLFSGRVGLMKPQPAMFELALQRFGIDPAQTLFIDDHPGNVDVAQRLGWQALLYTDAAALQSQLRLQGWLA